MKKEIRKRYINLRKNFDPGLKREADKSITKKLINSGVIEGAEKIMIYVSAGGETDTYLLAEKLIAMGKKVYAPRIEDNEIVPARLTSISCLEEGKFSIPCPPETEIVSPSELDAVIVPGVCFTPSGGRLGRGGGFYDRFLSRLPDRVATIGLCYSFQIEGSLPLERHDWIVDEVVDEKKEGEKKS